MSLENKIIPAVLFSSENLLTAIECGMNPDWFSDKNNRQRFEVLVELSEKEEWNIRNFAAVFQKNGLPSDFTNHEDSYNIEDWAFDRQDLVSVIDCFSVEYASRKVCDIATSARVRASSGEDPFDIAESMRSDLDNLDDNDCSDEMTSPDIAEAAFEIAEKVNRGEPLGLPFPWEAFQKKTYGIPFGTVCPLAGRDKKGKSRLSAFLAYYWISSGKSILYFPFEDRKERFISNLAAAHGGYDLFTIQNGYASDKFMDTHLKCLREVSQMPIHIFDQSSNVEKICAKIRKHKRKNNIVGAVIDGFKDVISSKGENRTQQENHIMQSLVNSCGDTQVACVPIMHLNKMEPNTWITVDKITGSGKQSQSARMRLFFQDSGFPDGLLTDVSTDSDRVVCLDCDAASYGNTAKILLEKDLEQGCFLPVSRNQENTEY
jgi:replicative DNA helicase